MAPGDTRLRDIGESVQPSRKCVTQAVTHSMDGKRTCWCARRPAKWRLVARMLVLGHHGCAEVSHRCDSAMKPLSDFNLRIIAALADNSPGVALCASLTAIALAIQSAEEVLFGRSWLEALVIAILLGTAVRTMWTPGQRWANGIAFCAKTLLELAVVLLGATVSASMVFEAGLPLLAGIAGVVTASLIVSYGLGRSFGLPHRMAVLIACGNSICGNSAIAAVAPIIGADGEDVATSIAFTAVLGVAVVLGLPILAVAWQMNPHNFGVLAGLTVYAVPQVLAATAPISSVSAQIGTLVKLVRVLMLGPIVFVLSILEVKNRETPAAAAPAVTAGERPKSGRPALHQLVPWFIVGFLGLVVMRSVGLIPTRILAPISLVANGLTIISMAALGLGVDIRAVAKAGPRVIAVVTLSLVALGGLAMTLIGILRIS